MSVAVALEYAGALSMSSVVRPIAGLMKLAVCFLVVMLDEAPLAWEAFGGFSAGAGGGLPLLIRGLYSV